MESMKYFVALALSFLVNAQGTHGQAPDHQSDNGLMETTAWRGEGVLASVREYPLFLHKCTATFLTPTFLLTTASCITCAYTCSFYVRVHSNHLVNTQNSTGITHPVYKTMMHPDYENQPRFNDIGIIMLREPAQDPHVYGLPKLDFRPSGINASIFSWHFNSDLSDYKLYSRHVKVVNNKLCSTYLHRFVQYLEMCTLINEPFSLGPNDHGSPIIGSVDGAEVILGTFTETGYVRDARIVVYQSVIPHISWIRRIIHASSTFLPPAPPTYSTTAPISGHFTTPSPTPNGGHHVPTAAPTPNGGYHVPPTAPTPNGGYHVPPTASTPNGEHHVPPQPPTPNGGHHVPPPPPPVSATLDGRRHITIFQ